MIALAMIFCFVPETKLLTLEELDRECLGLTSEGVHRAYIVSEVFEVPTGQFIRTQTKRSMPKWLKRKRVGY